MTAEPKWYAEGLKFTCKGCGDCCRGPGGYVWLTEKEIEDVANALGMTVDAFGQIYLRRVGFRYALVDNARGDCVMLNENGGCRVYDARPVQCRTFPWWPEILASEEDWDAEKKNCPGIGNGEHHPLKEILAGLKRSEPEKK